MTCPGDIELARAVAVGADPALAAHLDACAGCRAAWHGARAAIDAARELPVALPPAARREEMRTAILAAAAAGPVRRPARAAWLGRALAGAAAAGIAGYLALSHASAPAAPPHGHGTIRPHAGARYLVRSIGPDEVVWLGDGAIDVEVEPLHPGERFRVVVGGAELEVRGTAFTATARADHLVEVSVARGRVDLMPDAGGRASTTLAAGQSWYAAVAAGLELRPTTEPPTPIAELPAPTAELPTP
ncbi:MAG TPA: hypothetical protein VK607_13565, partial [Kofleriaceae bacterium]|nr:hypothetical protein [Kofleriaceae bacterium]